MGRPGSSGGANYLKGMAEVQANLNKELGRIKSGSIDGLIKAAAFIRYETEHTTPLTPRDLGNLVSSWFVTTASRTPEGKGAEFKGPRKAELSVGHISAMTEAQGIARSKTNAFKKFLIMGYSANYAGFIHEMLGATHFHRPGSDIKWLEIHLRNNIKKMVEIVRTTIKIKK